MQNQRGSIRCLLTIAIIVVKKCIIVGPSEESGKKLDSEDTRAKKIQTLVKFFAPKHSSVSVS